MTCGRLAANIDGGRVGSVPVAQLSTDEARTRAYAALAADGTVSALVTDADVQRAVASHVFFETYIDPSAEVTTAAANALKTIGAKVGVNQALDLTLDALSLASIYFLAAIGLAITFGVMGVINMAHGEFIMMGAYTGYVVQQVIPDHTVSILVAIPLAFAVTFAAGVAMERLVIRWLYSRPLETLLATFGISIALQQLAKNIFGTQARPLTSPGWLDGAWVINDVVSISYIRIAIFILAFVFLAIFLFIMKRTRLGLETRAVTQNPRMAASMGINPGRVNMLTLRAWLRNRGRRWGGHWPFCQGHIRAGQRLHRAEFHDGGRWRRGQHLGDACGRCDDRVPAKGYRMVQPVQHSGGANLHDCLHHYFHPVPAKGHHCPQRPCRGGLIHATLIYCP